MQRAGEDLHGRILRYANEDDAYRLARSCRAWWRLLHRAWHAEHQRRHRWRLLRRGLPRVAAAAWGKDDPYMDALPPQAAAALRVLLAAEPGLLRQMPGGERDLMPYLCCHFGRWALLQQWAAAAALDAALAARPAHFWRLAQYADMDGASGAAEWWAFCRVWREEAVCQSFDVAPEDWGGVEAASGAALGAEDRARLGCLGRALGLEGMD